MTVEFAIGANVPSSAKVASGKCLLTACCLWLCASSTFASQAVYELLEQFFLLPVTMLSNMRAVAERCTLFAAKVKEMDQTGE